MKDSSAAHDELILLDHDVPEPVETDPFEDAITEEIVILDVRRLGSGEIELL